MNIFSKRSTVLLVGVSVLFVSTMVTGASAQGFTPFALPGGLFGQGASAPFLPAWGCFEDPGAGLSVLAGYAFSGGMNKFTLTAQNAGVGGGVRDRLYDYKQTSALYLAGELPVRLGRMGKALISGSVTKKW